METISHIIYYVVGKHSFYLMKISILVLSQTYQFLERVDQVLQVNVVPVGLHISQVEIIEPLPNLALEHKC